MSGSVYDLMWSLFLAMCHGNVLWKNAHLLLLAFYKKALKLNIGNLIVNEERYKNSIFMVWYIFMLHVPTQYSPMALSVLGDMFCIILIKGVVSFRWFVIYKLSIIWFMKYTYIGEIQNSFIFWYNTRDFTNKHMFIMTIINLIYAVMQSSGSHFISCLSSGFM